MEVPGLIARLYATEDRAKGLMGEERLGLRQRLSSPAMAKPDKLLEIRRRSSAKIPAAKAVRYALNQWGAVSRFLEDGDLENDNAATERPTRDIGQLDVFGSDNGGAAAAVLLSFIAMCKRNATEPFVWFR
jgi:hypothetical protein